MKKDLTFLRNIEIAHRGLWNSEFPENSIGAFKKCITELIPIELDVHILKDNTLIVFHDNNLKRMTNRDITLRDSTYNDIKDVKLKNTNYTIPTLEEVLNLVNGKVLLDIEIKTDVKGFKICYELCKILDDYKGKFIIKSFNPLYIWWFRIYRPNIVRGLLVSSLKGTNMNKLTKFMLKEMYLNFLAKPDFIAFNYKDLPNKKIAEYKKRGIPILIFTIKESNIIEYKNDYTGVIYEE